ncbi:MAG: helix-turn-helix transcriptional regulator [Clostridia bacterium]|nr:helix-turn-helix transcriptional regulator [Clostridia bacterium]
MIDICNFIPPKDHPSELEFIHFVYETGIRRLNQPFVHFFHRMFLVFKGSGALKLDGKTIPLKRGDLFVVFGYQSYEIEFDDELSYFYISFGGSGALPLLESMNISRTNCHFALPDRVLDFWVDSIRRVNAANANPLTESVLMYTLSFVEQDTKAEKPAQTDKFDMIIDYINHNFTSPDMSLGKVADIFYYTEKHLSYLFSAKMGVRFTQYISDLRIHYAKRLLKSGCTNISEVASRCGFGDRFYFSKIFKKTTGITPSEYVKNADGRTQSAE